MPSANKPSPSSGVRGILITRSRDTLLGLDGAIEDGRDGLASSLPASSGRTLSG